MWVECPGKIMLAGEYSVLKGGRSLASTLNCKLKLRLESVEKNPDQNPSQLGVTVHLSSPIWSGPRSFELRTAKHSQALIFEGFSSDKPSSLFETVVKEGLSQLSHSHLAQMATLRIAVEEALPLSDGVGSSSGLILASLGAIKGLEKENFGPCEKWESAAMAFGVQRQFQGGIASGYDFATQVLGGLVVFSGTAENWPGMLLGAKSKSGQLNELIDIFCGGRGAPTTAQVGSTSEYFEKHSLWPRIIETQEKLIDLFAPALEENPPSETIFDLVGALVQARLPFVEGPHFPKDLFKELSNLPNFDKTWTCKTTGAGGEDAMLVIGSKMDRRVARDFFEARGWKKSSYLFSSDSLRIMSDVS